MYYTIGVWHIKHSVKVVQYNNSHVFDFIWPSSVCKYSLREKWSLWSSLCFVLSFLLHILNNFVPSSLNLVLSSKAETYMYMLSWKVFYGFSSTYPFEEFNKVSEIVTGAIRSKVGTSLDKTEWGKWGAGSINASYASGCYVESST